MRISISDDYATVRQGEHSFYYGYEETMPNPDGEPEWCFRYEFRGKKTILPFSALGLPAADCFECTTCLLAGMAKVIAQGAEA